MSFKPITNSQYDILKAQSKIVLVACEPGAGATWGLVIKAIHEAQNNGKFVLYITNQPQRAVSANDVFSKLLKEEDYRFSALSQIFTFNSGGRIKLVDFRDKEVWVGSSFDWIICDHRFEAVDKRILYSDQHVVVSAYPDVMSSHEWFDGLIGAKGVELIKMASEDNFFMKGDRYYHYAHTAIPQHFGFHF